ncbi:MAG TPA: hypothetical protein DCF70_03935 [Treponema sp.]|nr:hypothetical protein [Treponema sp.]
MDFKESKLDKSYLSNRTEVIFFTLTAFFLLAGTVLIAFSNAFIPYLYEFFSKTVFHREFSIDKWLPTLQSFVLIPIFLVLFVNAIVFHKHTDRVKIFYIAALLLCIAFLVTYTVLVSMHKFIDADLSSETLLALECVREKSLVPLGWGYSTEIRLLNTQLISAPLFVFIKSWDVVRALTSLVSCAILSLSCWFLLSKAGVKKTWLKLLGAAFVSCPWSSLQFYVIGWGNYYIPHIVLGFLTLSIFIPIANGTTGNRKRSIAIFYLLAFVSGLSTIRYILIYQFPLALAVAILSVRRKERFVPVTLSELKQCFWENKVVRTTLIALFLSGAGYVFNNAVLQRLYNFSQWNDVTFNHFGDVSLLKLLTTILRAFGYQENVAVFTPSGVINVCVYIAVVFFVVNMIASLKAKLPFEKSLILVFSICTIAFNTFLYYHTEFIGRYYITVLAYMIPCVIIFIDSSELGYIKRYCVGTGFALCIFVSSYTSTQDYLTRDFNIDLYPVMDFLKEKVASDPDYSFGYSTFDFANLITYFTNEKIEVATVKKARKYVPELGGKVDCLPDKFTKGTWLTPLRYNRESHSGKVFLMLSEPLYRYSADNAVFKNGREVYNDGKFLVFEYASQAAFKSSFGR